MVNTKFIQHKNVIYTFDDVDNLSIQEQWMVVKNYHIPNIVNLVKVWRSIEKYKCEYDSDVMKSIAELKLF